MKNRRSMSSLAFSCSNLHELSKILWLPSRQMLSDGLVSVFWCHCHLLRLHITCRY